MKRSFFLVFFFLCLLISHKGECLDSLDYSLNTTLSSSSNNFFNLSVKQQIDFECLVNSISPIDQSPETVTLILKRIQGEVSYNGKKQIFDTDQEELFSLEFQCLKKLLNEPIEIHLNRDMTIKEEVKDFNHLLSLSTLEDYFINQDLLDQMLEAVFLPKRSKFRNKPTLISLYFPFKTCQEYTPELKETKETASLLVNENLHLEGLYSTHQEPFSVNLDGKLVGNAKWKNKEFYTSECFFSHKLKEAEGETLFENPLTFEYALSLKLTN